MCRLACAGATTRTNDKFRSLLGSLEALPLSPQRQQRAQLLGVVACIYRRQVTCCDSPCRNPPSEAPWWLSWVSGWALCGHADLVGVRSRGAGKQRVAAFLARFAWRATPRGARSRQRHTQAHRLCSTSFAARLADRTHPITRVSAASGACGPLGSWPPEPQGQPRRNFQSALVPVATHAMELSGSTFALQGPLLSFGGSAVLLPLAMVVIQSLVLVMIWPVTRLLDRRCVAMGPVAPSWNIAWPGSSPNLCPAIGCWRIPGAPRWAMGEGRVHPCLAAARAHRYGSGPF